MQRATEQNSLAQVVATFLFFQGKKKVVALASSGSDRILYLTKLLPFRKSNHTSYQVAKYHAILQSTPI